MIEKRAAPRSRVYLAGQLNCGAVFTLDCVVRNANEHGAKLQCTQHVTVPGVFRLVIFSARRERIARMVWRNKEAVGVAFIDREPRGNVVAFPHSTI
jgi:hypothetical protein